MFFAGLFALVLALVGGGLWMFARPAPGDPDRADGPGPRGGAWDQSQVRVMLAGDSMTQGAGGDLTWRFHLWNHLDPHVGDVEFVGPYTDPATPEQIWRLLRS